MSHRDDQQDLIEQASRGDTAAFGHLVRRYRASVHAYIVSRIGDFDWADDIAQETFVAAFAGLAQLRDASRFSAWLRAIADNMCALWLRRTQRERSLRDKTPVPPIRGPRTAVGAMPDELAAAALARLSPADAAAVTLYYCDGLNQQECGDFLGVTRKAVECRLYRARRKLREEVLGMTKKALKDHCPDDSFDRAVVGEIDRLVQVLGGRYRKGPVEQAEERLRVLFDRNTARLTDLIRQARTRPERRAALRMVRTLGAAGVEHALPLILGDDRAARLNALMALPTFDDGAFTYAVLEAIRDSAFSDQHKAQLLCELVRRPTLLSGSVSRAHVKRYAYDSNLYMEMLTLHGSAAVSQLTALIQADAEAGDEPDPWLARALVRFGTDAVEPVAEWIGSGSERTAEAAMELIRLLMEGTYNFRRHALEHLSRDLSEADLFLLARQAAMPVVHPSRLTQDALKRLGKLAAGSLEHASRQVRLRAASALGHFDDEVALPAFADVLGSGDAEMATAACISLGKRISAARVEPLTSALERPQRAVHSAAGDALGQIWSLAHSAAEFAQPEDDPATQSRLERIARLVAPGAELAMVVSTMDASRERILAALGTSREPADGGLGHQRWPLPLAERIGIIVQGRKRRREEHARFLQTELGRRASEYHRKHPRAARPRGGLSHANMPASVRMLPEDREYREKELSHLIAVQNSDPALARRRLYEEGWMARAGDRYRLTQRGRRAWRIERLLEGAAANG